MRLASIKTLPGVSLSLTPSKIWTLVMSEPPRYCRRLWGALTLTEGENWISLPSSREEDEMARRGYPPEFRRRVIALVEGGRKVADVAVELEVSEQTILH